MNDNKTILVTGGAGFIGSALVRYLIQNTAHTVVNVDKLTYAGNLESLKHVAGDERYHFEKVDICDRDAVSSLFSQYTPDAVMHMAAESHVDRSIDGPKDFMDTNIMGTYTLLEAAREYLGKKKEKGKKKKSQNSELRLQGLNSPLSRGGRGVSENGDSENDFRFLHVSTDEVYGSLGREGHFSETTAYKPNSPYSASKAASDHLVRAWYHTFNVPAVITNCSNNYGPYQFPEKLIPVVILNALNGKPIPVYGKGENIRDWLFVDDHVRALLTVLEQGTLGETYVIGGHNERTNLQVVETICRLMDELHPQSSVTSHQSLITFVKDRPGHDLRYAIDPTKIRNELGWQPEVTFEEGMRTTVQWYLDNLDWCERILSGEYRLERLGLGKKTTEAITDNADDTDGTDEANENS